MLALYLYALGASFLKGIKEITLLLIKAKKSKVTQVETKIAEKAVIDHATVEKVTA